MIKIEIAEMNDCDDVSLLAEQIRETNKLSHEDGQVTYLVMIIYIK